MVGHERLMQIVAHLRMIKHKTTPTLKLSKIEHEPTVCIRFCYTRTGTKHDTFVRGIRVVALRIAVVGTQKYKKSVCLLFMMTTLKTKGMPMR